MNIVMMTEKFYPHGGGVERHLYEVCRVLSQRGHKINVLTELYAPNLPKNEDIFPEPNSVRIKRVPFGGNNTFRVPLLGKISWKTMIQLRDIIASADILHFHDFSVFIYWYFPLWFCYPGKPYFITFHGWEGDYPPQKRIIFLRKISEKMMRGNICAGEFICKWYGTRADIITYGGVNLTGISATSKQSKGALFASRLEHDTGIMIYLEALDILKKEGIHLHLTVCGDGSLSKTCENYVKNHGLDVEFVGWVENPRPYIMKARYVFTSGFLSMLEAMAERKLVFSVYDNPIKEDYLKLLPDHDKYLFIAGSAEELASQLNGCIKDVNTEQSMIDYGYQRAVQNTWDKVADQYEKLWNKGRTN